MRLCQNYDTASLFLYPIVFISYCYYYEAVAVTSLTTTGSACGLSVPVSVSGR